MSEDQVGETVVTVTDGDEGEHRETGVERGRTFSGLLLVAYGRTRRFRPILILLIVLLVVFGATQGRFLTKINIENSLESISALWVVSIGMTLVLISGGFDLSVGATASLVAYFMAKVVGTGMPGGVGLVLALALGAVIGGGVNGVLVGALGLNVFVVTLASMTALSGVLSLWSNANSIYLTAPLTNALATGSFLGIPLPIWIMALVLIVGLYLQSRTYFGRDVYAIGGNTTAARLSGIRTKRRLIAVYAIVGACAALAGVLEASQAGAATPDVDPTLALQSIAAVLLGGTALTGGIGGVGGTVIGALFLGLLANGLDISGVSSYWQEVATGFVLVGAVLGNRGDVIAYLSRRFGGVRDKGGSHPPDSIVAQE
ncbi:MAG TPA: ABC transporter permease [Solirubrobacteraceae bacterium]|jgi:ribose transport system permease protein|nr:ABC transporter permease [Solirubrobacteraceae bacterium]